MQTQCHATAVKEDEHVKVTKVIKIHSGASL